MPERIPDREAVMMCGALLLVAGSVGTDDDVEAAATFTSESMAFLIGRFLKEAQSIVDAINKDEPPRAPRQGRN